MTQAVAYLGKGRWFKSFCRVDVVVIWNPALASESEGRNLHMWSSMHWLTSLNVRFLLCLKTCPIQKLLRESSEICLWLCLVGGKENGFQSVVQREVWVGGGVPRPFQVYQIKTIFIIWRYYLPFFTVNVSQCAVAFSELI